MGGRTTAGRCRSLPVSDQDRSVCASPEAWRASGSRAIRLSSGPSPGAGAGCCQPRPDQQASAGSVARCAYGCDYDPSLPHTAWRQQGTAARFTPDYTGSADELSKLAYAAYAFDLTDYAGPVELH